MKADLLRERRGVWLIPGTLSWYRRRRYGLHAPWLLSLLLALMPGRGTAQYLFSTNNGALTIQHYSGSGGVVNVPATFDGLPVTSIGDFAFAGCTNLTRVTVPNGVTNIGFEAFYACTELSAVTLPASVSGIGDGAFQACTSLARIDLEAPALAYSSLGGVLFNRDQTQLIAYPGGKSGSYAVPGTVTRIGVGAFGGCSSLTEVTIPPSVATVADSAFYGCSSLGSVLVTDGVTNIGNSAFYSCTCLTNLVLGARLTTIGDYAFASCRALGEVRLQGPLSSLGYGAFLGSGLVQLTLPAGVQHLGDAAFEYCSNLTAVVLNCRLTRVPDFAFDGCLNLANVTLGESVTALGVACFGRCSHLSRLCLPGSITNIADSAFLGCTRLSAVCFLGNRPAVSGSAFGDRSAAVAYYLPGASGWSAGLAGRPAMLWDPWLQPAPARPGGATDGFGFSIRATSNLLVVVEATTDLNPPHWLAVGTNQLVGGSATLLNWPWTNCRAQFYRVRPP